MLLEYTQINLVPNWGKVAFSFITYLESNIILCKLSGATCFWSFKTGTNTSIWIICIYFKYLRLRHNKIEVITLIGNNLLTTTIWTSICLWILMQNKRNKMVFLTPRWLRYKLSNLLGWFSDPLFVPDLSDQVTVGPSAGHPSPDFVTSLRVLEVYSTLHVMVRDNVYRLIFPKGTIGYSYLWRIRFSLDSCGRRAIIYADTRCGLMGKIYLLVEYSCLISFYIHSNSW